MRNTLKDRTISGIGWSFTNNFFGLGINFIIGIILARLLSPQEFGLIGMTTVFISISHTFIDSGFSQALIRKKDCSNEDFSTVFYYNLLVGVFIYVLIYFAAGLIAEFFKEPELTIIVRVLSLSLFTDSLGIIQRAILIKNINFKLQTKITIIATIISGIIGIWMAYQGYGVWSLVYKTLILNLITTVLLWLWNNWRPKLIFNYFSFREMFGFGSKLLITSLLSRIFDHMYYLVIGRFFSAAELGFYTRAEHFKNLPSQNINNVISKVTYPVLSSIQEENTKLKSGYKKLIKNTMLITFVLMIGLAAVANNLILTLIGEQWLPAVPYLELMCFSGMFYPLHALNLNMLKVKGRSDLYLKLALYRKIFVFILIPIAIHYGIIALLIGRIITSFITYYINSYWSGKMIGYPAREQLADIAPSFFISLVMAISVFFVGDILTLKPIFLLIIQIITGGLLVIVICEFFKYNVYIELKIIVLDILKKLLHQQS